MANKKARQRISYVLPLSNCSGGHRLGVNGLAFDRDLSILYSGGRDGAICAWDLNVKLKVPKEPDHLETISNGKSQTFSKFRAQTEAHTHWVNDIVLANNNTALVSASSDLTVKIWRPFSSEIEVPQTIGQHADYVKCLATPSSQAGWVASGGLDRKVCLWDLNGAGKKLEIETRDEEKTEKGSVYALATNQSILASGGPESIVRLWDPRSAKRITKFVGHTDNIRDILINKSGDTVMTASSDQTIKIWSVTACRCMHTLTIHNDSVWSLYSDDPELSKFYSSDRSGFIVKTNLRGTFDGIDNGVSLAIAQENNGVNKVIASEDFIWTATSSSHINRWANIDPVSDIQLPITYSTGEGSIQTTTNGHIKQDLSAEPITEPSNTSDRLVKAQANDDASLFFSINGSRKGSAIFDPDLGLVMPIHTLPQETIEGQHGLVKHKLLNDRRRVLTLDTTGEVLLWDLLKCIPIKSFGKRHLEDVEPEVNTMEAVAPWCSIDTRTGSLAVILEENNCFDAEVYADELDLDKEINFREDQRINLGKWALRNILSNLLDEIIISDESFRKELCDSITSMDNRPSNTLRNSSPSVIEAKDPPGGIVASPSLNPLPGVPEDEAFVDKRISLISHESVDYVSSGSITGDANIKFTAASGDVRVLEKPSTFPNTAEKEIPKELNTFFSKKFRKGMSFSSRKNRSASSTEKSSIVNEKVGEGSETSDSGDKDQEIDDNFGGVVQRIRKQYQKNLQENKKLDLESGIKPSSPSETPMLKLPPLTTVIIQEETSGGSADLYRGTVATVGKDIGLIEERAPRWLGELLLKNKISSKEPIKVSFILQPWQELLPKIGGADGNSRLNANRMLRVKKILAYIAERIDPIPAIPEAKKMKPEEYLELYCYDQKLPISMTLATLRAHIWKGGADLMLYYRRKFQKQDTNDNKFEATSCESN